MSDPFRIYGPTELGPDGYPPEWHRLTDPEHSDLLDAADLVLPGGLKHVVRALAGQRCVRCLHPYRAGFTSAKGEWSPCDQRCEHPGPLRWRRAMGDWEEPTLLGKPIPTGQARWAQSLRPFVEAQWRILTVHHLSMVKADCRWWNLVALCQRCHLEIQGRVQMARVWPWEHSEWFRPYVAGYYASVYLGEDLTREQTMARLDELLALERQA